MMEAPENFAFPFEPYQIQKSFMKELYLALETGKLGIFESPTGTGKSLSLCCGSIQWLKDHKEREKLKLSEQVKLMESETKQDNSDENDWLYSEYDKIKKSNEMHILNKKLEKIKMQEDKISKLRSKKNVIEATVKRKFFQKPDNGNATREEPDNENQIEINDDDEFMLEEKDNYDSDPDDDGNLLEDCEEDVETKVIFCSRTHSQLSQFINEIKKTSHHADLSVVSLASRQQYCINPSVLKLKSQHLINEQCLDLQKNKKGKITSKDNKGKVTKKSKNSCGCPFFNQSNTELLKDKILVDVMDIEDLVRDGKEIKACPYYSARAAVKESQVIVLPYQTILHKATRCANGISLKNNIIIVDEAHNLLETIGHIYGSEINGIQLQMALDKLKNYRDKYSSRFASKNLLNLNQIIFIVGKVLGTLKLRKGVKNNDKNNEIHKIEEFLMKAEIDNYNLRPLLNFCIQSKLAQKLHGFSEKYPKEIINKQSGPKAQGLEYFLKQLSKKPNDKECIEISQELQENSDEKEKQISVGNVFQTFVNFLEMLTSTYSDGRIITVYGTSLNDSYHKFLLLNPAAQFFDIVKEARSVIVAGGTMQPFSEFRDQLFIPAGGTPERIVEFSCGHVIPPDNILPICLSEGPSGKKLNFTYEMRKTPDMLNEVGRILLNVCNVIPGGIVCFFPSYDYEKLVHTHLFSNGIIEKIQMKKKIFREPKTANQVDQVLAGYSKVIHHSKLNKSSLTGAIMFSVIGGKLSEGLNFSDDLGRCVIVIGMPYPNSKSIELQEKMKYLKENISPNAGNIHYENLCIKAINQSIGRAVRHSKDYAVVLLVDERYSRDNVCNALPKWIKTSLVSNAKFGNAFGAIRKFFIVHK